MPYREPYFARYVKSWRKPPKWNPPPVKVRKLQHCKACTHTCDYAGYSDHERSLCPYYNLQ